MKNLLESKQLSKVLLSNVFVHASKKETLQLASREKDQLCLTGKEREPVENLRDSGSTRCATRQSEESLGWHESAVVAPYANLT